ncbi:MAG TPA: hypothetical protein VGP72_16130 [Planctomycetota bacterium]|jgi:hypothetical protein
MLKLYASLAFVFFAVDGLAAEWLPISDTVIKKLEDAGTKPAWPGGTAGVTVDRTTGDVYMIVSGQGCWKSSDQGASFERVDGGKVGGRCETGFALNFDPQGKRLACFMLDGPSARTLDAGKTWEPMNDKSRGFDFAAVDWTAEVPKVMWGVRHESGEIGLLSDDGKTWKVLDKGYKAFGVFDAQTLITSKGQGLLRSTDNAATWTKVCDTNPTSRVMVLFGGAGYWNTKEGLLVSKDKGATWSVQGTAVDAVFGPYFGKDAENIVVVGKPGFQETTDGGKTWKVVAPLPPGDFGGNWFPNFAWDPVHNVFYASRMGKQTFKFVIQK